MEAKSLIKLNIDKNKDGNYQCPITYKEFNDHTHIVAIRTSGNVYCYDAIEELNLKAKNFRDLLSDEKFTRKDIITLQDPHQMSARNMLSFDFVRKGVKVEDASLSTKDEKVNESGINTLGTTGRVLAEIAGTKETSQGSSISQEKKRYNEAHYSTGLAAYSVTSMAFTPATKAIPATITDEEYLFTHVKDKGQVLLSTNHGDITLELFCKEAPQTCYNFIQLCKNGNLN
jgi:peptidyl-prolyl cis-trans isomerase-like protein 2